MTDQTTGHRPTLSVHQIFPMRFQHVERSNLDLFVEDDGWVMEQKIDGARMQVRIQDSKVWFISGNGGVLKHSASTQHLRHFRGFFEELARVQPELRAVLDGEIIGSTGVYWLFDVAMSGQEILPEVHVKETADHPAYEVEGTPFAQRREYLERLFEVCDFPSRVKLLPQAKTTEQKRRLAEVTLSQGAEGVMAKRLTSTYEPGKRVATCLKVKWTKTAEVICLSRDRGGKKNAEMGVFRDGHLVKVGNVTMIGKGPWEVSEVAEVKFLYMGDGGHLYQPRFMRLRPDKPAIECTYDQFTPVSREIIEAL